MLEGMQSVAWNTLTHGGGSAVDLPDLLRRVGGPSAEVRREALRRLYQTAFHRRAVWEATAPAVPFLIELLGLPRTGDKQFLLVMLGEIGRAGPPSLADGANTPGSSKPNIPERELEWVRSTRAAVLKGRELYGSFLDNPVPSLRACAAFAVALSGGPDPRLAQALRDRIAAETADVPRASMVIALNHMDDLLDGLLFQELQAKSQGALTKWAAAAAQVARWEKQAAPQAVDLLTASLSIGDMVRGVYADLPWGSGNMVADTASLLSGVGPGAAKSVVPRLLRAFRGAGEQTSLIIAEVMIRLSFPGKPGSLVDLPPYQKEMLSTFAESARLGSASPLRTLLGSFGLPETREGLRALVGR
jgi:hypothetical protein